MKNYSKNEIVLIKYPFSDLSNFKVRPAVVANNDFPSYDLIIIPLTSKITNLHPGEFLIIDYAKSGLNVQTAVKRGLYTIDKRLVVQSIGFLGDSDSTKLTQSICYWLGL